jgi:hypothetical protein
VNIYIYMIYYNFEPAVSELIRSANTIEILLADTDPIPC